MSDAYIVGVDMIKFGRFPERSALGSSAIWAAFVCEARCFQISALRKFDFPEGRFDIGF